LKNDILSRVLIVVWGFISDQISIQKMRTTVEKNEGRLKGKNLRACHKIDRSKTMAIKCPPCHDCGMSPRCSRDWRFSRSLPVHLCVCHHWIMFWEPHSSANIITSLDWC
jgi:hypothetical protein